MKAFLAEIFRFLFGFPIIRKYYFAVCKYFGFFRNVKKSVIYRDNITLDLDLGDWVQQQVFFLGDYEKKEIDFLHSFLRKGDVFFDIGANFGLFSLNASKIVGSEGKVYAFEPFEPNFRKLIRHISLNNLQNITVEKKAVSDCKSTSEIRYDEREANLGMASLYTPDFTASQRVETISIDDYVLEHHISGIDLIKMDIEGGEYLALHGMRRVLRDFKPSIIIEVNPDLLEQSNSNEQEILDFFEKHAYKKTKVLSKNNQSYNALFQPC